MGRRAEDGRQDGKAEDRILMTAGVDRVRVLELEGVIKKIVDDAIVDEEMEAEGVIEVESDGDTEETGEEILESEKVLLRRQTARFLWGICRLLIIP